ncbi:methylenetetrahydrofolate reductase [NAD(P)H] [Ichthyobacterium seriolicida]|uniref:Methylenetetrahydrofolate reductase n=1 Tax=Ichthyobacterium seriolicida TaxID=242600 RepID=A0A1J1DWS9_9FLAO|nr:methylenetetrahydrofolate reductase [NAD(P)H] [Ichthyobacterium seriolicida]BAV94319.1 5,10-methylenetetrahydrofolate reductase [Ichthyobacterium seriolicida]
MKVSQHIEESEKTLFSIEILPPLRGENINYIYENIDPLIKFDPSFIDVTFHKEEYLYEKKDDGSTRKKIIRKRPGTVGIAAAIMNKYQIDTVPHILCNGSTKEEVENMLIDLNFLGIENVLALRGDFSQGESSLVHENGDNKYASDLVKQINEMNNGRYLNDLKQDDTNFCVGVAGYPEKHSEATDLNTDIKHLKNKVDQGADYIVTQMFFDNSKYMDFVDKCEENDISVPIIPGLKPISTKKQLKVLPEVFDIEIPEDLQKEVIKCKDNKQVRQVGIEWAVYQSKELVANNAPVLHYYTMGRSSNIEEIASKVF